MSILLCASTKDEIASTIDFIQTEMLNDISILITSVGLIAATYNITKAAIEKRPDFIIQAGIAGALHDQLMIGETVFVESESLGDMGVIQDNVFTTLFDLHLAGKNDSPWKNGKLVNPDIDKFRNEEIKVVGGVSVNEISTSIDRIRYYKKDLGTSVETMEGAALHYVGLMENIKFLQVRSVSNYAGERNKKNWGLNEAIYNLNNYLKNFLIKQLET